MEITKQRPPDLPAKLEDWVFINAQPSITDRVQEALKMMLRDDENGDYVAHLNAVDNESAIEGSIQRDRDWTALRMRDRVKNIEGYEDFVKFPMNVIGRSISYALRRANNSPKQRLERLINGGSITNGGAEDLD